MNRDVIDLISDDEDSGQESSERKPALLETVSRNEKERKPALLDTVSRNDKERKPALLDTVSRNEKERKPALLDTVSRNGNEHFESASESEARKQLIVKQEEAPEGSNSSSEGAFLDGCPPSRGVPGSQGKPMTRQFWKAGDYDIQSSSNSSLPNGMDHVRVHPKFLHSNATSHKWALGAIAELLDNSIDEVPNGATFVHVDMVTNALDNNPALQVHDDGGGMDPDNMRHCMSLGYSRKTSKMTIGQYGNGFKTSTMRLGADVIVFSRCVRNMCVTQSVGLLSYTFLRATGHEDIVVPMVDFEVKNGKLKKLLRTTEEDWIKNFSTLLQWSPYNTEGDLLKQFDCLGQHGTLVIVYNLWMNDDGELELDFDADVQDILVRGTSKSESNDTLQKQLTNKHIANRLRFSLRAYASVLYLRMPSNFQIILRGEIVEHLSIADDLKFAERILYKPNTKDFNYKEVSVITTIGFAKEAPLVSVHGFNVYHKNRLIMPFWKVFQENSSRGRGVVGVLEANFMEPAHDKQDFERTPILQRLETRLKQMSIEYWNLHCNLIGYQGPKQAKKNRSSASQSETAGYGGTQTEVKHGESSAPSTPPQPGADVLAVVDSTNAGKRASDVLNTDENRTAKRHKQVTVLPDQGYLSALQDSGASIEDILEELDQLRERCKEYKNHEELLKAKVAKLEAELHKVNGRYRALAEKFAALRSPKKES